MKSLLLININIILSGIQFNIEYLPSEESLLKVHRASIHQFSACLKFLQNENENKNLLVLFSHR